MKKYELTERHLSLTVYVALRTTREYIVLLVRTYNC